MSSPHLLHESRSHRTASGLSRTMVSDLPGVAGQPVTLRGWLHHRRALKSVLFLILRDRTGTAQVVVGDASLRRELESLPHESVLAVTGTAITVPQAPGGVEIHDPVVEVVSRAVDEPPFDLYRPEIAAALPTRLDDAAVALRHPKRAMMQRLVAAALAGFRAAMTDGGFVEISTPKIVGSATEGGANVFALDYFGRSAYLAQSPQLYKQILVGALERVFETAPAFRAEPHDTTRHVSQFLSLDAEMGFIEDHHDVMAVLTAALGRMIAAMGELSGPAMVDPPDIPATIPEIHFRDALSLISEATGRNVRAEPDLAPADERWLGDWARRTHGSEWLYVTGYPMAKRPFYTHPEPGAETWSNSFDLLFRGLEVVTGGQRLHRHEDYLAAMAARGIDPAPFEGYLAAFRHGMPPHGGFALGLERLIARIAGIENVRDAILFPRDMQRLTP